MNTNTDKARANWLQASRELNFKLITPYVLFINGVPKNIFAFLPEYGSPNGVVVELMSPPDYTTDGDIIKWAKENNVFYSFVNVETVLNYSQIYFVEMLEDWAKFK